MHQVQLRKYGCNQSDDSVYQESPINQYNDLGLESDESEYEK